jgi:hypothetical protein
MESGGRRLNSHSSAAMYGKRKARSSLASVALTWQKKGVRFLPPTNGRPPPDDLIAEYTVRGSGLLVLPWRVQPASLTCCRGSSRG